MQRKTDQAMTMPDFFDFTAPTVPGVDEETVFACSSSDEDGAVASPSRRKPSTSARTRASSASTPETSNVGHPRPGGRLFLLTVEARNAHSTHLATGLRRATVAAMTKVIGPENTRLRAA